MTAPDGSLDAVFHALSDASRRRIVHLLRESGELRVSDLAEAFSMSLNGVSKHVKVLEQAGLVTRRVEWREHWLSLEPSALRLAYEWVHFYHQFWTQRVDALGDVLKEMLADPTDTPSESDSAPGTSRARSSKKPEPKNPEAPSDLAENRKEPKQ